MYGEHLMLVMKELKRVLKKTGTLFWNMGDSFASSGSSKRHFGYPDPKWAKARNGSFEEPTAFDQGIKPKSLMGIPEHFMLAMLVDGWVLRNKLPWIKRNAIPSSKRDGFTPKWEYVYFFTKASKKYYFDLDSIRKPLAESSIKRISQKNIPNQSQKGKSVDNGANTGENNKEPYKQNNPHLMRLRENKRFFNEKGQGGNVDYNGIDSENGNHYNQTGSNPGDVLFDDTIYDPYTDPNIWDAFMEYLERERPELLMPSILDIPTRSHKFAHFAVMPETLVDPLIKVGSPSEVCVKCGKPKTMEYKREIDMENEKSSLGNQDNGIKRQRSRWVKLGFKPSCKCNADFEPGTVLDPFAGSGTVGVVAKKQGKSAILIEISPEYVEIIKNRLEIADSCMNIKANIEVASIRKLEEFELEVKN
jgi:hypothetical protein